MVLLGFPVVVGVGAGVRRDPIPIFPLGRAGDGRSAGALQAAGAGAEVLPVDGSDDTRAPGAVLEQCPHCRGAVRPGAPWCTQCWADLRPAPPEPEPAAAPGEPGTGTADRGGRTAHGWPCTACGHTNAVELAACAACGTGFLAGLRGAEAPLLAVPGLGDLARYSRAQRLALAGGVVLLVCLLVLAVGLLLG